MHGLNQYDYHARHYDPSIGRFTTIDPLAEKFYSWSPYAYCYNNPMKFVDPDGRFPLPPLIGKIARKTYNLVKDVYHATSANVNIGFQIGGNVKLATGTLGVELNYRSVDIIGVKDGTFFHPGKDFDKSEVRTSAEIGVAVFSIGTHKTETQNYEENTTTLKESGNIGILVFDGSTSTTKTVDGSNSVVKETKESSVDAQNISGNVAVGIGIRFEIDSNKLADAIKKFLE